MKWSCVCDFGLNWSVWLKNYVKLRSRSKWLWWCFSDPLKHSHIESIREARKPDDEEIANWGCEDNSGSGSCHVPWWKKKKLECRVEVSESAAEFWRTYQLLSTLTLKSKPKQHNKYFAVSKRGWISTQIQQKCDVAVISRNSLTVPPHLCPFHSEHPHCHSLL